MKDLEKKCGCTLCKNDHDFIIDDELMAELLEGKVTVFAGAGISTETRNVLQNTFYETVASDLGQHETTLNFPELMEEFCQQTNGRFKLLKKIKDRFDYIDSFPELNRSATRFHREIGTFFPIKNIITTNWDIYFERYCKATPFVTDPDLAFWEAADRRVLKIHGSVTNFGSIVATTSDYEKCQQSLSFGLIGGLLKTILATQTVIFIGYSLSDPDFSAVYEFVKEQMNSLHKQAYVVSPFIEECEKFRSAGLIPINTDGTFFFSQVKAHAVAQGLMLDDEVYEAASDLLEIVSEEHNLLHSAIKASDYPEVIFASSYQDGMMHALERAIEMRGTGQYSHHCRITGTIQGYLSWEKKKLQHGVYEDVAYIEGYINALTYLLMEREDRESVPIPIYFMFGVKDIICDLPDYIEQLKLNPKAHKAAHKRALRYLKRLSHPDSVEFHHPPWL